MEEEEGREGSWVGENDEEGVEEGEDMGREEGGTWGRYSYV